MNAVSQSDEAEAARALLDSLKHASASVISSLDLRDVFIEMRIDILGIDSHLLASENLVISDGRVVLDHEVAKNNSGSVSRTALAIELSTAAQWLCQELTPFDIVERGGSFSGEWPSLLFAVAVLNQAAALCEVQESGS